MVAVNGRTKSKLWTSKRFGSLPAHNQGKSHIESYIKQNMDEQEALAIENDQKLHPNCGYSMSLNETCSNNEQGDFVCDAMRSIQRMCPGKRPETIFSKKTQSNGDPHAHSHDMPFGGRVLDPNFNFFDQSIFKFAEEIFENFLQANPQQPPSLRRPNVPMIPPHRQQEFGQDRPSKVKGKVVGQVEDI
ncbi:hypothetical protein EON65_52190 [archaeon]|nr:MAG: hypothetical protein EON65_52190 [archaeon]